MKHTTFNDPWPEAYAGISFKGFYNNKLLVLLRNLHLTNNLPESNAALVMVFHANECV